MPLRTGARAAGEENMVVNETAKGVQLGNGKRRCAGVPGRAVRLNTRPGSGPHGHPPPPAGPWETSTPTEPPPCRAHAAARSRWGPGGPSRGRSRARGAPGARPPPPGDVEGSCLPLGRGGGAAGAPGGRPARASHRACSCCAAVLLCCTAAARPTPRSTPRAPPPPPAPRKAVKQQQHLPAAPQAAGAGGLSSSGARLTRSQTRALQAGVSLSSLLQARSEASSRRSSGRQQPCAQQRALPPLPDIDGCDRANPLAACEYVNDVYRYYRRVEPQFRVPADYMSQQVRARGRRAAARRGAREGGHELPATASSPPPARGGLCPAWGWRATAAITSGGDCGVIKSGSSSWARPPLGSRNPSIR
jgi:hypothetical protein